MNSAINIRQWSWLGATLVLCAGTWWATRHLPVAQVTGDSELVALLTENKALTGATDRVRDEWRMKTAARRTQMRSQERVAELRESFGPDWTWKWEDREGAQRRAVLLRRETRLLEWKEVLTVLRSIEGEPGITLEKIEIRAFGAGSARRLVRIVLTLRIEVQPTRNAERASFLRPLPVAWLGNAPRLREVGRLAPLASSTTRNARALTS